MLAELFKDKKIIRQIKEILFDIFDKSEAITGKKIVKALEPVVGGINTSSLLYSFLDKKILLKKKIADDIHLYSFKLNREGLDTYISNELKEIDKVSKEEEPPVIKQANFELVATYPEDDNYSTPTEIKSLLAAIRRSIKSTNEEILMTTPFVDTIGMDAVIEDLVNAAKKGVIIKLITRETFTCKSNSCPRIVLKKLRDSFKEGGVIDRLFIRDYHIVNEETGKQQSSVHAKLLLFDNKRAYIGSANMTYSSLYYNFELGVIIERDNLNELHQAFYRLWDLSRQVELSSL